MIEFLWLLQSRCNYTCPYCSYSTGGSRAGLIERQERAPREDWLGAWERVAGLYGRSLVYITGSGEPTTYPGFTGLITSLKRLHDVAFDTNLSWPLEELRDFIARAGAEHLRVETSFHPHCADLDSFIEKASLLREAGVRSQNRWVAYPPMLDRLPEFRRRFEDEGLSFTVTPFRGTCEGAEYPAGYTLAQRRAIIEACLASELGGNTIADHRLIEHLCGLGVGSPGGRPCRSGAGYACVMPDGVVFRCQQYGMRGWEPLGSLFDPDFALQTGPAPCRSPECGHEIRWLAPSAPEPLPIHA